MKNRNRYNEGPEGGSAIHPFMAMVNKEISDYVRSWRFIILLFLIFLTCLGSVSVALTNIDDAVKANATGDSFIFLRLFTASDGTLPSFFVFISFLGPLLGLIMGFDAINAEENKGTLSAFSHSPFTGITLSTPSLQLRLLY
jgi:ABC-2 type transport system permease protein